MNTKSEILNVWRAKLEEIRQLGMPKLSPSSRRMIKDEFHAYGGKVSFRQTVIWPDGKKVRVYFSDIGVNKSAAIGNSLRCFNADDMSRHHPDAEALYQTAQNASA